MSDETEEPAVPAESIKLGGALAGGHDTRLSESQTSEGAGAGADDRLRLPRNGLIAYRKSGGLRFTSRGIIVYRNGRVLPLEGAQGNPRRLSAAEVARLERLILRSELTRAPRDQRSATRDGYGYEIVTRIGNREWAVELSDPVPTAQARLVRALNALLPAPA
ncbi:MAG: hypothetical protein RMK84_05630 [Oscillochloridaceae bacterium]|nr:hypothetical protein [Chloroflexaceae bacterium]MDW8389584.1 hypothetical protein [Oscillochloridaceae bacterium]